MPAEGTHLKAGWRHMLFHAPYSSIDFLSMIWLTATVPVFLFLPPVDTLLGYSKLSAVAWAFVNLIALAAIVALRVSVSVCIWDPMRNPWKARFHHAACDCFVVVTLALVSHEGSLLASLVWHGRFFDNDVQALERAAWGAQPSMEFHQALDNKYVGEYFMVCYTAWPLILIGSLLTLQGNDEVACSCCSDVALSTLMSHCRHTSIHC